MQERSIVERTGILERKVESSEQLPARVTAVEVQIVRLRDEIRSGDEDTRRYMRVLHEEVLERISTIQEGRRRPRKKRH